MSKKISSNASLPADVRYHKELSGFSKVLYAELYLRAGKRGFCYPTNAYLANLFSVSSRTIQRALEQLKKVKAIEVKLSVEDKNGRPIRQIYPIMKTAAWNGQTGRLLKTNKTPTSRQKLRTRYD